LSAMRCSTCGISYPIHMKTCPVCEDKLWLDDKGGVDEWWEWRATLYMNMHQEGAATPQRQPFYLVVPVTPLIEGKVWRTPLQAVYQYDHRRMLLADGTFIETPTPDWDDANGDPPTTLWEVYGRQRDAKDDTYYLLTPVKCPTYVPDEWVAEFDGD